MATDVFAPYATKAPVTPAVDEFAPHVAAAEPPTPENGNGLLNGFEAFVKTPPVDPTKPFGSALPTFKPPIPPVKAPAAGPAGDVFKPFVDKSAAAPAADSKDVFAQFSPSVEKTPAKKQGVIYQEPKETPLGDLENFASGTNNALNEAGTAAKEGFEQAFDANKKAGQSVHTFADAFSPLTSAVSDAGDKISNAVITAQDQHASALQKGVAVGDAGVSALNALFSPFSVAMNVASKVPVVGKVADVVSGIFGALGNGEADLAGNSVNTLPISEDAKNEIRPLVQEVGALTAQLLAGKAGGEILPEISSKSKVVLSKIVEASGKDQRGFVANPFYSEPVAPEVEQAAKAPIEQKAKNAASPQAFFDELTPEEVKTLIKTEGTDEHIETNVVTPPRASLEPVPDMPGVYQEAGAAPTDYPIFYYDRGTRMARIDAEKLSNDFYDKAIGKKAIIDNVPHRDTITPERTRVQVQSEIQDMENLIDISKENVDYHPAKGLLKYYGRNDPGVTGLEDIQARNLDKPRNARTGERAPVSKIDQIVGELGYVDNIGNADVEAASEGVRQYIRQRTEFKAAKQRLADLRRELADMKKNGTGEGEQSMKSIKSLLRPLRLPKGGNPEEIDMNDNLFGGEIPRRGNVFGKEKNESNADLLRRGANIERLGPGKTVDARGLPHGDASEGAQYAAANDSQDGEITSGPFKGWTSDLKGWFQKWVHGRQSAKIETVITMKPFEQYKADWEKEGIGAMFRYEGTSIADTPEGTDVEGMVGKTIADAGEKPQVVSGNPDRTGPFRSIEKILAKWLEEEQAAGVPVHEKPGYLPLYLADERDTGPALGGKQVGLRPGFTMARQFDTYADAVAAGKTPLYDNMYDVVKARATAHFKAMADAKFFNTGVARGWVVPKSAIAEELQGHFRDFDSERFPSRRAAYGNVVYNGVYASPESVAEKVNTYLRDPNKFLHTIAEMVNAAKGSVMSVGVPGTAINPHLFNILPREVLTDLAISPKTAPREFLKFAYYTLRPSAARAYIEANLERAMPLFRNGMSFSAEGMDMRELDAGTGVLGSLGPKAKEISKIVHEWFGGNMFGGLLPARKIYNGLRVMDAYKARGMTEDEAAQQAADDMSTMYGGINTEALGRSKDWQNFLRATIFAPDYAETNVRLGARVGKGMINPGSKGFNLYGKFGYWLTGAYIAANLLNYENSGKWMFQNDPTHAFDIAAGKDSKGKTRYIKPFGTGVDFLRFPAQFALALVEGKGDEAVSSIRDRLSTFTGPLLSLISNTDYRGDPIFGPDKYGNAQGPEKEAVNLFNNTIGSELPGSVDALTSYFSGGQSGEQTIANIAGLPLGYKNQTPTLADVNAIKAQASTDIGNGDYTLFNKLVKAGVITATQERAFIRAAITNKALPQKKITQSAATKVRNAAERKAAESVVQ